MYFWAFFLLFYFTSPVNNSLFDELPHNGAVLKTSVLKDKEPSKRSLAASDYNLVYQHVSPVPYKHATKKRRKLKKVPIRFQEVIEVSTQNPQPELQEVIEVSTKNPLSFQEVIGVLNQSPLESFVEINQVEPVNDDPLVQEVREIKRYSLAELEQKFPSIFKETRNSVVKSPYNEVYEVKKMKTKYTPSHRVAHVNPVYKRHREREIKINTDILKDVNLGSDECIGDCACPPGVPPPPRCDLIAPPPPEEEETLFGKGSGSNEDKTQIIITLTNNPEINLFNGDGIEDQKITRPQPQPTTYEVGPPTPPPSSVLTDSYGVPLSWDTTNRPGSKRSLFSDSSSNSLFQDNFGSTGTFSYDFSDYSIDVYQPDNELTTPRLPTLSLPPTPPPSSISDSYAAPLSPVLSPIDYYQPEVTNANSYLPPRSPPDNSYQSPQAPPSSSYQPPENSLQPSYQTHPPQQPSGTFALPQGPPIQGNYKNSDPQAQAPMPPGIIPTPESSSPSPPSYTFTETATVTATTTTTDTVTIRPSPTATVYQTNTLHHHHTHNHKHKFDASGLGSSVTFSITSQSSSVSSKPKPSFSSKPFTPVLSPSKPSYQPRPNNPTTYKPRPSNPVPFQPVPSNPVSYQPRPNNPVSYQPRPNKPPNNLRPVYQPTKRPSSSNLDIMSAPSNSRPPVFQPLPSPPAPPPGPPAPPTTGPGPWKIVKSKFISSIKDKLKRPLINVSKTGKLKLPFIDATGSLDLKLG